MRTHDRRVLLSGLVALVIGSAELRGQSLQVDVSVDGAPYVPFTNVPTVNGTADVTIFNTLIGDEITFKIYDAGTGPVNDSLGQITINGSVGTPQIRLLFAREVSSAEVYPSLGGTLLVPGLLHLGTPGQPVIVYGSTDLRDRTRVAAAVIGDVRGDLTAGRITRVQALGLTVDNTLTGGTILGNITSTRADEATDWANPNGALAIGHIVAGRELLGDVTAQQPAEFNAAEISWVPPLSERGV
jgi:hypothetical protein